VIRCGRFHVSVYAFRRFTAARRAPLRLRYERESQGYTQVTLGEAAGLSSGVISGIESGRINPTQDQLDKLARVLRITPSHVLLKDVVVLPDDEEITPEVRAERGASETAE
jgi:transcriptional regulator with XRE-family HTH domain